MVMKSDNLNLRSLRIEAMKRKFLDQIAKSANISEAARVAGIDRGTAYNWRQADPVFNDEWIRILKQADKAFTLELVDSEP